MLRRSADAAARQGHGREGEYVVYVGTLTTPLHNTWADAAIAYQKEHYPDMKLVADRFPGADEIDTAYKTTLDVIKAYPNLKGFLGFGSNGPIGAGNAVREKRLGKKFVVVGTVLPRQAKADQGRHHPRRLPLEPDRRRLRVVAVGRLVLDGKEIKDGIEIRALARRASTCRTSRSRSTRSCRSTRRRSTG